MKHLLRALLLVCSCSFLAVGCSTTADPVKPVDSMLKSLYFKSGTYEDYRNSFETPSKVISEQEFKGMQEKGSAALFDKKSESDVLPMLRSFQKDDKTAVVYWVDFTKDKSSDMHWNVVKTDNGWKIEN